MKAHNDSLRAQAAELAEASAKKDADTVALSRQIQELLQAQEQMAVVVARLAHQQVGQTRVVRSSSGGNTSAIAKKPARTEIAGVGF